VASLSDAVSTAAGLFEGCLRLLENLFDPDDADVILFAPGVGRVAEASGTTRVELVSHETR
jgi:hypothetical protein